MVGEIEKRRVEEKSQLVGGLDLLSLLFFLGESGGGSKRVPEFFVTARLGEKVLKENQVIGVEEEGRKEFGGWGKDGRARSYGGWCASYVAGA